jgi:hypothetical protein
MVGGSAARTAIARPMKSSTTQTPSFHFPLLRVYIRADEFNLHVYLYLVSHNMKLPLNENSTAIVSARSTKVCIL